MLIAALVASMAGTIVPVSAVEKPPQLGEPGLRAANVPASVPNISGVWQVRGFERQTKPIDADEPPWLPWNRKAFEERAAAEKSGRVLAEDRAATLRANPSLLKAYLGG